jgi:excisionase family DNA binding protein
MGTDTHHREANRAAPQVSTANVIPNHGYTPDMDDALVTTEEAARQLGIRPRAIVARIKKGEFPGAIYLGSNRAGYRIPQSDIDAYKTRNRIPETAITAYIAQRQENQ